MEGFLQKAKASSAVIATLDGATKSRVLRKMADALEEEMESILQANAKDMAAAEENELSSALKDRLFLDEKRVEAMARSLREIAALREPVGRVLEGWRNDANLRIEKVSVPIGVVGVIYESRPNVTADVGALCFKSGNVAILKGGKEAEHSNRAIAEVLQGVLEAEGLPREIISLLPDSSREGVAYLIRQDRYVDLIVPRGGETLIRYVSENATVPVVKHDKGLCHTYVHRAADQEMALKIALNAKCDRPGVCNAMETLLVDRAIARDFLPKAYEAFRAAGTELRADEEACGIIDAALAAEEDWDTEYLANILAVKVVENIDEAITHIRRHGSGHSEAIITEDYRAAEKFLDEVDAACVYVNASTRFTDGGAFGFGAEVGISTNKLHARGPMGINELTTYKYKIYGEGQTR
ncbi:glutamate-5-semialdehyde dehydrogenase [Nitratifractor salsuginis]|uniref:Gamma-glutamyl phosphate reductase n=1 Tax=Nitratifractor salsuginis (strain DSM 16511 / JCM 12458 / E9I37-1) TaxID=749222 RepID=E6WXZ4_NITSE|nr:glutamate-5-semialdehyde dehydrogenase [Nitratifractor salsuginis]ADV46368.1 glutamate-5-semialdehyde dehydrogenase [Nitratifractor salsuginis DSM 16511]